MFPDIGVFHPQIVHFVIALLMVGVVFRLISLTGKAQFTGAAALTLILIGTGAAVLAVKSGEDAHGPAERVPGARDAVGEHEEWGERTRNLFLVVAALELLALGLSDRRRRAVLVASGVVGLGGMFVLYETAEHGGDLVYQYAGGVGVRSGDPNDLSRLLLAGLYHNAVLDRSEGRPVDAARLIEEMSRRFPDDRAIALLVIESLILDRENGEAALEALARFTVPEGDRRLRLQAGLLAADALQLTERTDSAQATLEVLLQDLPSNQQIENKLAELR